ncbi:MAG: hypothetical protein M1358_12145 [Chloroflexi bacterium]|nr:hypothetical protein [Chloroflexota bacterium]
MPNEVLFHEIEAYLAKKARKSSEVKLLHSGILLALLVMRGVSTQTRTISVHALDKDAARLRKYLLSPGLAPNLARARWKATPSGERCFLIRPNWPRIARYYGRSLEGFRDLLVERFPEVVNRHRQTIMDLMRGD